MVSCYPPELRDGFREDMIATFRAAYLDRVRGPLSWLGFWGRALWEGLETIPLAWWERWTGRRSAYQLGGRPPKRGQRGRPGWGDAWLHELRLASKGILRRKRFAATIVGTLALGIAGVTTLASVVWGVILAPLPFPDADRLVGIGINGAAMHPRAAGARYSATATLVEQLKEARTLDDLTFFEGPGLRTLRTGDYAEEVSVIHTAGNTLSFLGADVALGRLYSHEDEVEDDPVVVIAHDVWVRRHGRDPAVVGSYLSIDGVDHQVTGVLADDFEYALAREPIEYWSPRPLQINRGGFFYRAFAHIGEGLAIEDVASEAGPMVLRAAEAMGGQPSVGPSEAASVWPIANYLDVALPQEQLWLLFGASWIVLALACANVASLLLVNASDRSHELALRSAIGAGRGRLAVHLLSEASMLALAGGAIGAALSPFAVELVKAGAPDGIPRLDSTVVGWPILGACLLITTATVLLIGTLPAVVHSRPKLERGLATGMKGSRGSPRASWLRQGLLVTQVCGAFVMLLGTGLMLRTYGELVTEDLGFTTNSILHGQVVLPEHLWAEIGTKQTPIQPEPFAVVEGTAELRELRRTLVERLEGHPQASRVALARYVPLSGRYGGAGQFSPGGQPAEGEDTWVSTNHVAPSFFELLDVRLLTGRLLTERDGQPGAAPVAVVSEALARRFWPNQDPIGQRFRPPGAGRQISSGGTWENTNELTEVVGVVASLRESDVRETNRTVYFPLNEGDVPLMKFDQRRTLSVFIETDDEASVMQHTRQVVAELLPGVPIRDFAMLDDIAAAGLRDTRFYTFLFGIFGGYVTLLAGMGIASSVASIVSRRRFEIGVRIVLGATIPSVLRLVVGRAALLTLAGLLIGVGLGFVSTQFLESLLYGVSASDPMTQVLTVAALLAVAVGAALLPVTRSLGLDPMESLKAE
jgi:putative ABC transport system permease protein